MLYKICFLVFLFVPIPACALISQPVHFPDSVTHIQKGVYEFDVNGSWIIDHEVRITGEVGSPVFLTGVWNATCRIIVPEGGVVYLEYVVFENIGNGICVEGGKVVMKDVWFDNPFSALLVNSGIAELNHVTIRYADTGIVNRGNVIANHLTITHAIEGVRNEGEMRLENVTFRNNAKDVEELGGNILAQHASSTCCTLAIFVPGFQASRLYEGEEMRWEPSSGIEVARLHLSELGVSEHDITAKEPIDELSILPIGQKNVYKDFLKQLHDWKEEHVINDYMSFGYDWRFDAVTAAAELLPNEVIQKLGEDTHTIAFIGHSNGGLVVKAILQQWQEAKARHQHNLIDYVDSVTYVAVPHQGAVKAVASLLHGYGQSNSWIRFTSAMARQFGAYLIGAYGLLPTEELIQTPIVYTHATTSPIRDFFSHDIDSVMRLDEYLTTETGKVSSTSEDMLSPIKIPSALLARSREVQRRLQDTLFPLIRFVNIVGFGLHTPIALEYVSQHFGCLHLQRLCTSGTSASYEVKKNKEGDGTVPVTQTQNALTQYFDMARYNMTHADVVHADILEAEPVQEVVKLAMLNTESQSDVSYISTTYTPPPAKAEILFRTESPVQMHVYDAQGRHVGLVPVPDSELFVLEQEIPGSFYHEMGYDTEVYVPEDGMYRVELQGTADGFYSYYVKRTFTGNNDGEILFSEIDMPISKDQVITHTHFAPAEAISQTVEHTSPAGMRGCPGAVQVLTSFSSWLTSLAPIHPFLSPEGIQTLEALESLLAAKTKEMRHRACMGNL